MKQRMWAVGVDFGGTNIKCGLVDRRGRVVTSLVLSTARFGRPTTFVVGIHRAVEQLAASARLSSARLAGIGIGVPGLVDAQRGVVHMLTNVRGWCDVPLAGRLRARLHVPVFIDNDANLVTLGEWRWGAGRGAKSLVCLTLGTGVGGGLVFHGALYRGASGAAGEIGHTVLDPDGPRCGCGARGCLEAHVGTAAIVRMARQAGVAHRGRLTPEWLAWMARRGDRRARAVWHQVGRLLGRGLAGIVNLLNPDRVVIGGGVANAWALFAPSLRRAIRADAMEIPGRTVRVVRAQLGDQAGVIGAAVLVWEER
ncbi:MAG: ROK family protein [Candidatus Omnitrophica bacterium]|nr:ROK family protein [Candidatus Omnitrophota bacterium]